MDKEDKKKSTDRPQVPNKCIAQTPLPASTPPRYSYQPHPIPLYNHTTLKPSHPLRVLLSLPTPIVLSKITSNNSTLLECH